MNYPHTLQEFADMLNNRQYMSEITKEECQLAKKLGYVVVFAYSDDNMEIRGVIDDEFGDYDGGTFVIENGQVSTMEEYIHNHPSALPDSAHVLHAQWCFRPDYAWTYEIDVPYATFTILEDDAKFCQGIVFQAWW